MTNCKHCNAEIKWNGLLWVEVIQVPFPQYCPTPFQSQTLSQKHEPITTSRFNCPQCGKHFREHDDIQCSATFELFNMSGDDTDIEWYLSAEKGNAQ